MAQDSSTVRGSCLCRAVAYEVSGSPGRMWYCHSIICRKLGGAAFATHVEARASDFHWIRGQEFISRYEVVSTHVRAFCRQCGSVLPYPSPDGTQVILPAGGLDDDSWGDTIIRPLAHAYVSEKVSWHNITDSLPTYASSLPDSTACIPLPATLQSRVNGATPVQGSCLCGGIVYELRDTQGEIKDCLCWRDRKATGSAHDSCLLANASQVHWLLGQNLLTVFSLPEASGFRTGFCRICGTNLPAITKDTQSLCIPAGSLDGNPGMQARYHIYCSGKAPWFDITDDLPQFELYPPPGFDWRQQQ